MIDKSNSDDKKINFAEVIVTSISFLIVFSVLFYMTYDHFSSGNHPPYITIKTYTQNLISKNNKYYLPLQVLNQGDNTAKGVQVHLLVNNEAQKEDIQFQIDFLAGNNIHKETVILNNNPLKAKITYTISFHQE